MIIAWCYVTKAIPARSAGTEPRRLLRPEDI